MATGAFDCDQSNNNNSSSNNAKGHPLQAMNEQFLPNEDPIEQHFNYNPLYTGLQLDHDHEYVNGHDGNEDKSAVRLNNSKQHDNDVVHQHRLIENNISNGTINQALSLMQVCDNHNVLENLYNSYNDNGAAANRNVRENASNSSNNRPGGTNNNENSNNKQHCQTLDQFLNQQQQRRQHSQNIDQRSKLKFSRTCNQIQKEPSSSNSNDDQRLQHHYNQPEQQQQEGFSSLGIFNNNGQYNAELDNQVNDIVSNLQCQSNNSARPPRQKSMIDQQQDVVCDGIRLQQQQTQKQFVDTGTTDMNTMATSSVNLNNDAEQFQGQGHQQQFFVASGVDNSEEPMFADYQSNRVTLGISDDLHNMNVINCDNETLEEQINMLSNEDFMTTPHGDQIDYHGFASNDQFLNMLFSGAGCTNSTTAQTNGNSANNINGSLNIQTTNATSKISRCNIASISPNQLQKQQEPPVVVSLSTTTQQSQVSQNSKEERIGPKARESKNQSSKEQSKKLSKTSKRKDKSSQLCQAPAGTVSSGGGKSTNKYGKKGSSQTKTSLLSQPPGANPSTTINDIDNGSEFKIATANTNKRLMPKKTGNAARNLHNNINPIRRDMYANNSCITSPTSTSNTSNSSVVSPNANQFEHESSYKLQLDNLRKKLKMDVVPVSSKSLVDPNSSSIQANSAISLIATTTSNHHQNQTQQQQLQDTTSGGYHPQHHIQHHHQIPIQVLVRGGVNSQNLVPTNCSTAKIRSSQSNLVQNNNDNIINKQSPIGNNNNSTTYVIAKPIEGQPLDPNHGSTIYVSTSSGLMQVATQQHHRQAPITPIASVVQSHPYL